MVGVWTNVNLNVEAFCLWTQEDFAFRGDYFAVIMTDFAFAFFSGHFFALKVGIFAFEN